MVSDCRMFENLEMVTGHREIVGPFPGGDHGFLGLAILRSGVYVAGGGL